jgi:hypothetical protein
MLVKNMRKPSKVRTRHNLGAIFDKHVKSEFEEHDLELYYAFLMHALRLLVRQQDSNKATGAISNHAEECVINPEKREVY